nr:hypothetical protein [uncultured Pseudomonas sp.]
MKHTDNAADDALLALSPDQRNHLADLIEAERKSATRWWTYLNEMRAQGALPDWVFRQFVGTHKDLERYEADCEAVNRALFGKKRYIRYVGEPVFISTIIDIERNQCTVGARA